MSESIGDDVGQLVEGYCAENHGQFRWAPLYDIAWYPVGDHSRYTIANSPEDGSREKVIGRVQSYERP